MRFVRSCPGPDSSLFLMAIMIMAGLNTNLWDRTRTPLVHKEALEWRAPDGLTGTRPWSEIGSRTSQVLSLYSRRSCEIPSLRGKNLFQLRARPASPHQP